MGHLESSCRVLWAIIILVVGVPVAVAEESSPESATCIPPLSYSINEAEIRLERVECLGECPQYIVKLTGDGTGSYEGIANVMKKGTRRLTISRDDFMDLLRRAYQLDFFQFSQEYGNARGIEVDNSGMVSTHDYEVSAVDGESFKMTVRVRDCARTLRIDEAAPRRFWLFAERVDEIAGTAKLVGRIE